MNNNSIYVKNQATGAVTELAVYDSPVGFQITDRYLTVTVGNVNGYVPLDYVGGEFDSGLRCSIGGDVYQVSSSIIYNIIDSKLTSHNMFVNLTGYDALYKAMVYLFGTGRVKLGNGFVSITSPTVSAGITKLFTIGVDLVLVDGDTTWSTSANGWTSADVGGDRRNLSKAMLLKLDAGREFKLSFANNFAYVNSGDLISNCLIVGSTVESLPDVASSYANLRKSTSYCMFNDTQLVSIDVKSGNQMYDYLKGNTLNYVGSDECYNFYQLGDAVSKNE